MTYILDTHVLVWWVEGSGRLTRRQRRILDRASPESPLLVSDVTLWEVARLEVVGEIEIGKPLEAWLEEATSPPLVELCAITPAIAVEAAYLPEGFPRDPADRIITATARVRGATLLTLDRRIIESGVVPTIS